MCIYTPSEEFISEYAIDPSTIDWDDTSCFYDEGGYGGFWTGKNLSDEHKKKCSEALKGKKLGPQSEEHKKKRSEAMKDKPKPKIMCPHCGKKGGINMMHRWHFENCKKSRP
ncbi:MAG: NUMOD3 domain-containing DNA-binding protein [Candidatus Poseidoniales archaeon]